jgi:hypothetical protein
MIGRSRLTCSAGVTFLIEFGIHDGLRELRIRDPTGEGVREVDGGTFVVCERRPELAHFQAELEVGNDERGGHDFEAEDALHGGLLHVLGDKRIVTAVRAQSCSDLTQYFGDVRPGAAARIEDVDVRVRQAIGNAEFIAEDGVHACHHVFHDFGRRVPHTKLLSKVRIELTEEGFIEVADRVFLFESNEELVAVDAVQEVRRPVEGVG